MSKKEIKYNAAIFPKVMEFKLDTTSEMSGCNIELPRYVNHLYLENLNPLIDAREIELFEKYAQKMTFNDLDYEDIINYVFVPVPRPSGTPAPTSLTFNKSVNTILSYFGIRLIIDKKKCRFEILEDHIPEIRINTWDCILVDLLSSQWNDVIECFDFKKSFTREADNNDELRIHLGSYKFSNDLTEQQLSNALRTAFFYTLAGYTFGLRKTQYACFIDYFENEFYKRVSLVYSIWSNRKKPDDIRYIPLYDSFSNLSGERKIDLINMLKAILDTEYMAFDDKETLKNHLIDGCNEVHTDPAAQALEQSLIKPAMNYIMLREKSKETMQSAHDLYKTNDYKGCANRCFYAMTFALKALLEDQGQLAQWEAGRLKERENHDLLERKLNTLVSSGVIAPQFQADFLDVKDARWGCDYSIMTFVKADAQSCLQKMDDFCTEVERLTTH